MFKKFVSCLLILSIIQFTFLPAMASKNSNSNYIIDADFKTELNVNKASRGQVVQFVSTKECMTDELIIPEGTIFSGEIRHTNKAHWGYRRAKAVIGINEMILPDGSRYKIKAYTKKHTLKGSAIKNTAKGIITAPVAVVAGALGAVVIVVEAVSVVGLVIIGPTSYSVSRIMGTLTHGINYKKHQGHKIKLRLKQVSNKI